MENIVIRSSQMKMDLESTYKSKVNTQTYVEQTKEPENKIQEKQGKLTQGQVITQQ